MKADSTQRDEDGRGVVTGQPVSAGQVTQTRHLRRRMTAAERQLWGALRNRRLDGLHFRRQQVVGAFIVDFYCDAVGIVIEVDGPIHCQQAAYDQERDQLLAARGLRVVHVTNDEVLNDLPAVLAQLLAILRDQRGEA